MSASNIQDVAQILKPPKVELIWPGLQSIKRGHPRKCNWFISKPIDKKLTSKKNVANKVIL